MKHPYGNQVYLLIVLLLYAIVSANHIVVSDGFADTIDLSKWIVTFGGGTITASDEMITMQNGAGYPEGIALTSVDSVYPPAKLVFRIKTTLAASCYNYRPIAGFSEASFNYENYIYYYPPVMRDKIPVLHNGISDTWKTDSIIWTEEGTFRFYVEEELVYELTNGPTKAQHAFFKIYCDQLAGCPTYDLWIDTVYMEGETNDPTPITHLSPAGTTSPIRACFYNANKQCIEIEYEATELKNISCRLYDVSGRMLSQRTFGMQEAGIHTLSWDMKKGNAITVGNGVYIVSLYIGDIQTQKVLLIK